MSQNNFDFLVTILLGILPISLILGPSVSTSIILSINIIFLIYCIKNKFWSWIKEPYIKLIILLYVYLLFNNFIAIDSGLSSARNLGFIRYLIFIPAVIFFFSNKKNLNIVFFVWFFIIIITAIDTYYEFIYGINSLGFKSQYGNRIVSFFKDEHIVGAFTGSFLLIIVGFLFSLNQEKKAIYYNFLFVLSIGLIITSIIITGERSSSIRAILGLILFFYLCKELKILQKIYITSLILGVLVFMVMSNDYLNVRFYGQIFKLPGTQQTDAKDEKIVNLSSSEELGIYINRNVYFKHYRTAYELFKKYPLFGAGNKNYGKACFSDLHKKTIEAIDPMGDEGSIISDSEKKIIFKGVCSTHPHQIYFEFLSEHGLIGTILLLLIFFVIIYRNLINYFKYNNKIHLGAMIYIILNFLPLIPSGAFFGNYTSSIFWINFSIMLAFEKKN